MVAVLGAWDSATSNRYSRNDQKGRLDRVARVTSSALEGLETWRAWAGARRVPFRKMRSTGCAEELLVVGFFASSPRSATRDRPLRYSYDKQTAHSGTRRMGLSGPQVPVQ